MSFLGATPTLNAFIDGGRPNRATGQLPRQTRNSFKSDPALRSDYALTAYISPWRNAVYQEAGLHFYPAKKNRDLSGFDLINAALKPTPVVIGNEQKLEPELTFMKSNDKLVWQISHLRFSEWRGNVVDKDPPEKAQEKRRHLVDCLAYILLDEPYFAEPNREQPQWEPRYKGIAY